MAKKKKAADEGEAPADEDKGKSKKRTVRRAPFQVYERKTMKIKTEDGKTTADIKALIPIDHPKNLKDTAACIRWIQDNGDALKGKKIEIHQVKERFRLEAKWTVALNRE